MSDFEFIGYVVHLPGTDEFLNRVDILGDDISGWAWSATPELAITYKSLKKAKNVAESYGKNAVVARLFESAAQYAVTELA